MAGFQFLHPHKRLGLVFFRSLREEQVRQVIHILSQNRFPAESSFPEVSSIIGRELNISENKEISGFCRFLYNVYNMASSWDEFRIGAIDTISNTDYTDEEKRKATEVVTALDFVAGYYERKRLESYSQRGQKYYSGISCACSLRGRFQKDYDSRSMSIEAYQPELIDVVPMASINITTEDDQEYSNISFQATDNQLNELILNLLALQKDMKKLYSVLPEKKENA